ncbi:MAG: Gfo/Idh/MocA family oxidoreductase [Candidatus Thorarchaeota archaeon]|nr:Gfo/Idh/MocA family oxidoreductase [Candidatus Thorarchaeota archaeon]
MTFHTEPSIAEDSYIIPVELMLAKGSLLINGQQIRVGLIGTGNIGKIHLSGIAALKEAGLLNVEIVALCDIDHEVLQSAGDLFEVKKLYEDFKDLVNDDDVDVVYVCTPTNKHMDMVQAAARAKKQIFCEKPLAHSCPQARTLQAVTQDQGVNATVGLVLRFDQFLLYAKKLLQENDFGKPMLAHIRDDQRFPVDYSYYSKWRGEKALAGGGTLIEHSIHDIDILRWFFGEVETVFAKVSNFYGREVEDHASLIITHVDGKVSTLDSIWHWIDRPNERAIEFFFEKGYIGIRLESGKRYLEYHLKDQDPVRIWQENADIALIENLGLHSRNMSPEAVETITSVGTERYAALSYSFLSSIQTGQPLSPNFVDAVAAHRIVDAAYESANKDRQVDLL